MPRLTLNDEVVDLPEEDANLLGWLRDRGLVAAKPGCLGGDCGACQVLLGEVAPGASEPAYRAVNSCLLTTDLVAGCQVVTVEGLGAAPTIVQRALAEEGAIQCGYCTPGLVIALTAGLLNGTPARAAASGNLCRCTGYAGIARACDKLAGASASAPLQPDALLPDAVLRAGRALRPLEPLALDAVAATAPLGGNTDEGVRHPHARAAGHHRALRRVPELRGISVADGALRLGAAVTIAELQADPAVARAWPPLAPHLERFGSPAIRNVATVGGNLANASPVADLAVVLLALGAEVEIAGPAGRRTVPLAGFFHGYKRTDLRAGELVVAVTVPANADGAARLHAEKVARRPYDDIASVCSALVVTGGDAGTFGEVRLSAGGVAPVPTLLGATASALAGRPATAAVVRDALALVPDEVAPIDDVRGSASYKRRLLQHVVVAHVAALYPGFDPREVLS